MQAINQEFGRISSYSDSPIYFNWEILPVSKLIACREQANVNSKGICFLKDSPFDCLFVRVFKMVYFNAEFQLKAQKFYIFMPEKYLFKYFLNDENSLANLLFKCFYDIYIIK